MGLHVATYDNITSWGVAKPGYHYSTQVSRNGKPHQASHRSITFETAEQRDADLERNINASRKRALSPAARLKA